MTYNIIFIVLQEFIYIYIYIYIAIAIVTYEVIISWYIFDI